MWSTPAPVGLSGNSQRLWAERWAEAQKAGTLESGLHGASTPLWLGAGQAQPQTLPQALPKERRRLAIGLRTPGDPSPPTSAPSGTALGGETGSIQMAGEALLKRSEAATEAPQPRCLGGRDRKEGYMFRVNKPHDF